MQALAPLSSVIEHYTGLEQTKENEQTLQELQRAAQQFQEQNSEIERLRSALAEATDVLEREFLPALEDKDSLTELIVGFRTVLVRKKLPDEPMLQVLIDAAEQKKFEWFKDMNTMLVYMAGCATRERMEQVLEYQAGAARGLRAAKSMLEDEVKVVRDYCRFIALCEQGNSDDVQNSYESIVRRVFNDPTN